MSAVWVRASMIGATAALLAVGIHPGWTEVPAAAAGSEPTPLAMTQEEAIRLALAQNVELASTALEVRRQRLALRSEAYRARGFRLRPTGAGRGGSEAGVYEVGARAEQPLPWSGTAAVEGRVRHITLQDGPDHREARVAIEFSQPLFRRFGREVRDASVFEADDRLRAERRRMAVQQADLIVEVVRLYEDIQSTLRRIDADEAYLDRMEALHALLAARERRGQAGRVDVLKVELQRGNADLRLRTHRDRLEILRLEFCERLGLPLDARFSLTPAPVPDAPDLDIEEALSVAYGWRLDYAQAWDDLRAQRRRVSLAQRGLQPDLTLRARVERGDEGRRWSEAASLGEDRWMLGMTWEMDAHREEARLSLASAETEHEVLRRRLELEQTRIARDVHARLLAHRRAQAEEKLAFRNRRLAEDRAELARTWYRAGRGDAFTVSDAEDALLEADLAWLALRRDAAVTAYELRRALGTLFAPEDDLLPVEE